MSTKDIIRKAQKLGKDEQYLIVQSLLESLEPKDEKIEQLWIKESEKRLEAIKAGKMKTIPFEEVFK